MFGVSGPKKLGLQTSHFQILFFYILLEAVVTIMPKRFSHYTSLIAKWPSARDLNFVSLHLENGPNDDIYFMSKNAQFLA